MEPWRQYQHDAADVLRQLGFSVKVGDKIIDKAGVSNNVDVSARQVLAGQRLLWVVECKYWKDKPVPINGVRTLITLATDVGADRGLLITERGFQLGAKQLAAGRNITLTSLADLQANASEQLRLAAIESRLLVLSQRIVRDLRSFGAGVPDFLRVLTSNLSADDRAQLASRPDAVDFQDGLAEIVARSGVDVTGLVPPGFNPSEMRREWRDGVDAQAMSLVVAEIGRLTQLLNRGSKLEEWPLIYVGQSGQKLAWSTRQLLGVVEPVVTDLERQVDMQGTCAPRASLS